MAENQKELEEEKDFGEEKNLEEEMEIDQADDLEVEVEDTCEEDMMEEEACEPESVEEAEQESVENEREPRKGLFGKSRKEKKDKKDAQIEELTDKYKRTMAEFDNFRKRTEKEMVQKQDFGARIVIEKMLPIIDSFERGLATLSEEERKEPFADGMDKVYKQLTKAMEELGVTPIEAVGKEFDPAYHNAVMQGEDENFGENTVSEEFLKGYLHHGTVVRHSMVKVVNC